MDLQKESRGERNEQKCIELNEKDIFHAELISTNSAKTQAKDGNGQEAQENTLRTAGATEIYVDEFTGEFTPPGTG